MTGRKPDPVRDARIVRAYLQGVTTNDLARRFVVGHSTIIRALQAQGIEMRGHSLKKGGRLPRPGSQDWKEKAKKWLAEGGK